MSDFFLPATARDGAWLELRARLARTARALHFSAVSSDAANSAALLVIAGHFASLAISIPMSPTVSYGPVDASTLLAAQVLQLHPSGDTPSSAGEFGD